MGQREDPIPGFDLLVHLCMLLIRKSLCSLGNIPWSQVVASTRVAQLELVCTFLTSDGAADDQDAAVNALYEDCAEPRAAPPDAHSFLFSRCATPVITSVSRTQGSAGDRVELRGSGLTGPCLVLLGGAPARCSATDNATLVWDLVDHAMLPINTYHHVMPVVLDKGAAGFATPSLRDQFFLLKPFVAGVTPSTGGVNGGTRLSVIGSGFMGCKDDFEVMVGSLPCDVVETMYTEIVCVTTATDEGTFDVSVRIKAPQVSCPWCDEPSGGAAPEMEMVPCHPGEDCTFTVELASTPTVDSISNTSISANQLITLNGSGFGQEPCNVKITLGDSLAHVQSVSEDAIQFTALEAVAGTQELRVQILDKGFAESAVSAVEIIPSVEALSPQVGGVNGGNTIQITAFGMSPTDTAVSIGGEDCSTGRMEASSWMCIVPAGTEGAADVEVTSNGVPFPVQQYSYSAALTPQVDSVQRDIASSNLSLVGSGFIGNASVNVGSAHKCSVTSQTETTIECNLESPLAAGTYPVEVLVVDRGLASGSASVVVELAVLGFTPNAGKQNNPVFPRPCCKGNSTGFTKAPHVCHETLVVWKSWLFPRAQSSFRARC